MGNPLYNEQMTNSFQNSFMQFKNNPMQFLLNKKINIPQEFANNPQGAVQYLMNNGSMSQETFNQLRTMASQMGIQV